MSWTFCEDAVSRERLDSELAQRGFAVVRPHAADLTATAAGQAAWESAERVFGRRIELVERQPIAPVAWGTSFASTSAETPLHSDSQLWRNIPPHAQLMFCEKPAERGGETLLVDSWALLEHIERHDPALFGWLFERPRRIPFVFGDVEGPTVSNRNGSLVFTHSPRPVPNDEVAVRLGAVLSTIPPLVLRVHDGELLVLDNHRMLHGRTAFDGEGRRFTRLLVWLSRPLGPPPRYLGLARPVPTRTTTDMITIKRRAILDMLRGLPPGILARRLGVPEHELYAWRDAALAAMDDALEDG